VVRVICIIQGVQWAQPAQLLVLLHAKTKSNIKIAGVGETLNAAGLSQRSRDYPSMMLCKHITILTSTVTDQGFPFLLTKCSAEHSTHAGQRSHIICSLVQIKKTAHSPR
jgi:hypothetical protein